MNFMRKEKFEDQFKKLTTSEIDKIISKYSNYPMDKFIRLNIFYDQNKDKPLKVSITNQDRMTLLNFVIKVMQHIQFLILKIRPFIY